MNFKDDLSLSDEQVDMFNTYMNLLIEWNEKINLTAITNKDDILLKHFADSLTIRKYIMDNSSVLDLGTGAGFPGIPLKIVNNSCKVTLMDSLNKRILFLKEVINSLNLKDIEAVHGRAEEMGRNSIYREKFDYVTSRAVANLSTLLEYMMPFVKVGGYCICMKGPNIEEELSNAKSAIKKLGGEIELIDKFNLMNSDIERNIIVIKKINKINSLYPRRPGTPSKEPL